MWRGDQLGGSFFSSSSSLKLSKVYPFQKNCRTMSDTDGDMSLAGEGKLKHFKAEKKLIIYSRYQSKNKIKANTLFAALDPPTSSHSVS
jgi:hypothetical protein